MLDRELTQLQQHGAVSLMPSTNLAEVMDGIDTLGLDAKDVMLTVDHGLVRLLVTGPNQCEDCDGEGERILNSDWPEGEEPYSEKCSTCSGTGVDPS